MFCLRFLAKPRARFSFASLLFVGCAFAANNLNAQDKWFDLSKRAELETRCLDILQNPKNKDSLIQDLEKDYPEDHRPEGVKMLLAILNGSRMGPGDGWFGPARRTQDWNWLASLQGIDPKESIDEARFRGDAKLFRRLDRNGDGKLAAEDLDWGPQSPYMKEVGTANWIFRQMDDDQNGRMTREEWLAFFDKARGDSEAMPLDSFRRGVALGMSGRDFLPGDAPTPDRLIRGFFQNEIGSLADGPAIGEKAPDFELAEQGSGKRIRLASLVGTKPIVLVFGNFTCGPFRRNYPDIDEIARNYGEQAHFLGVYVREAHPEDGWLMESNTRLGVKLKQPKTIEERRSVAQTCFTTLKYSMPLLVDTMDDQVGNLYSAMPARAYVIDHQGKIVFQTGRGPYGFRPAELEQALALALLSQGVGEKAK